MIKANKFVCALTAGVAPAASTAGAINNAAGGAVNTSTIPEGAFALVSAGATRANVTAALAADSEYYFVKNVGGRLISSPAFTATAATIAANLEAVTYSAGASTKVRINGITAEKLKCEAEYMLKLRFESPCIMKTYGYQDLVRTVSYTTGCCADPCVDCGTYPCDTFASELVAQINLQAGDLVTAEVVDDGGCDFIDITAKADTQAALACGVDPMECSDFNVAMFVGLEGAFECSGAVVNTTGGGTTAYAQAVGTGRQILAEGAWAAGYYRKNGTTVRSTFPYGNVESEVDASLNYDYTRVMFNESKTGAAEAQATVWPFELIIAYKTGVAAMDATEVAALLA
tara:strand:- start:859 stop:1890 length:1032 start_codon:yes stop_codon:yes gene_type:complete